MKGKAGAGAGDESSSDPRRVALDGVLHQIERCYGRGSILKMGDNVNMNIETSSTGVRIAEGVQWGAGGSRGFAAGGFMKHVCVRMCACACACV